MSKTTIKKIDKKKAWEGLKQIQNVCRESKRCVGCPGEGLCNAEINEQSPSEWKLEDDPKDGIFKGFRIE